MAGVKRYEVTVQANHGNPIHPGWKEIPEGAVWFTRDQLELWVEDNVEQMFDGTRIIPGRLDRLFNEKGGK